LLNTNENGTILILQKNLELNKAWWAAQGFGISGFLQKKLQELNKALTSL